MTTLAEATRRRHPSAPAALLAICLCWTLALQASPTAGGAGADGPLDRILTGLLDDARLGEARVGFAVVDLATGQALATRQAEDQFIPASNMKLLTSGATLLVLGDEAGFETTLRREGDRLIIRGEGDPGFADPELLKEMGIGVDDFFDLWIEKVRESGGGPIREIVVDDRFFDDEAVHPTWPVEQLNRWYCAEVRGLNFHANVLSIYAAPASRAGTAPRVRTEPSAEWISLRNTARTVKKGRNTIWVARPRDSNRMTLHGNVKWATEKPVEVAMHDMPMLFGRLFADRLEEAGLGLPDVKRAAFADPESPGEAISLVRTPMEVILRRCNTSSHNLYAEAMMKRLGRELTGQPGSWDTGAAVLRMLVQDRVGAQEAASLVAADGSGMSRANRVTPELIVGWLDAMHDETSIRGAFLQSLAEPSEPGTMRARFRADMPEHRLAAKTGYLRGVSTLSGYVLDEASGRGVAFSVLVNDIPRTLPLKRVKDFQEQVVLAIDDWLDRALASAPADE